MDFFQKKRIFQEKNPIFVWQFRKKQYLCIALDETWAVSAVGSEHLPYKQRVGGSNPSLPTRAVRTTVRAVCCFTCPSPFTLKTNGIRTDCEPLASNQLKKT